MTPENKRFVNSIENFISSTFFDEVLEELELLRLDLCSKPYSSSKQIDLFSACLSHCENDLEMMVQCSLKLEYIYDSYTKLGKYFSGRFMEKCIKQMLLNAVEKSNVNVLLIKEYRKRRNG